jgi:hypothetical protein
MEVGRFTAGLQFKNYAFALYVAVIKRVNQSLRRPGQALRFAGG